MNNTDPLVCSRDDLLEMVAAMHLMKAPPLWHGQRTQDGMAQYASLPSKSLLSIGERGVHGDKGIIEAAKWLVIQTRPRLDLLGRLDAARISSNPENVEAADTLAQIRA